MFVTKCKKARSVDITGFKYSDVLFITINVSIIIEI